MQVSRTKNAQRGNFLSVRCASLPLFPSQSTYKCFTAYLVVYQVLHIILLHIKRNKKTLVPSTSGSLPLYSHSLFYYYPSFSQTCQVPYNSSTIVNGPSFSSATFISAPNSPVSTTSTCFLHSAMIYSYNSFARSGFPALIKDGRLPWLQSA